MNSAAITKAAVGALSCLKEVNFAANKVMQVHAEEVAGWTEVTCLNWYDNRIVKLAPLGHLQACMYMLIYMDIRSATCSRMHVYSHICRYPLGHLQAHACISSYS